MRMLLGLYHPSAGVATIGGRRYDQLSDPVRTVGALLEADAFHPGRSGRSHLRVQAAAAGIPAGRVDEVLDVVSLTGDADRPAGGYSLGMKQRLGLTGALLGDPDVLVLDEPANGLDPRGIRGLRALLRERAHRGSVLVSSHQLAEMALIADEVVVIREGALVTHARVSELTTRGAAPLVVRSPEAQRLLAALVSRDADVRAEGDGTRLVITGVDAKTIARTALDSRIEVHELTELTTTLEDAFLELTA